MNSEKDRIHIACGVLCLVFSGRQEIISESHSDVLNRIFRTFGQNSCGAGRKAEGLRNKRKSAKLGLALAFVSFFHHSITPALQHSVFFLNFSGGFIA